MAHTLSSKILTRLRSKGRGAVVTPGLFLDLGSRAAVDQALGRLASRGTIRRLSRGIYDYPRSHPELGLLSADPDRVARALASKHDIRIQPSGAYAANLLGLSEQVPARIVYLTDGAKMSVNVGGITIELRPTTPKNMATAGTVSGLVIQALRYLRRDQVSSRHVEILRRRLSAEDRKRLWADRIYAPIWMHRLFLEILEGEGPSSG